ncbi:MAG TPA: hypothetical protein VFK04_08555 [Gemmatimonadaceae bacterium]|nr:hypothetical protein [Gemmatimonadaceae bacterium]
MRYDALALAVASTLLFGTPRSSKAQQSRQPAFTEYTPGRCAIARRVMDRVARIGVFDTVAFSPAADTLYSSTTDSLHLCEASYGRVAEDAREVLNAGRVNLFTRQDSLAVAAVRRRMKASAKLTPEERAWEHFIAASDYLEGAPPRADRAREEMAALDRLGKPAASVRVLAHYALMGNALAHNDDSTARAEGHAAIAAWKELSDELKLWRATVLATTFRRLAQLEALTRGADAARAVIDTARIVVPLEAKLARSGIEYDAKMYAIMEKDAKPLKAEFWYNTGDAAAANEPGLGQVAIVAGAMPAAASRPSRGKVSVLLDLWRPCTANCYAMVKAMQRYRERFARRDVELIFLTQTNGFYVDTAPVTPAAEAAYDSSYFLHQIHLPGVLSVAETKYTWKADGRRINAPTANQLNYPNTSFALIDKKGVIRYVANSWSPRLEERYAQYIEKLLAEP